MLPITITGLAQTETGIDLVGHINTPRSADIDEHTSLTPDAIDEIIKIASDFDALHLGYYMLADHLGG